MRARAAGAALLALLLSGSCGPQEAPAPGAAPPEARGAPAGWLPHGDDPAPPTARRELVDSLREDLAARRHPSDGGGRVRLLLEEGDDGSVVVGGARAWSLEYEAGPAGVADGGTVFFQAPPFWGWDTPQVEDERAGGFTRVRGPDGVGLEPATVDRGLLAIGIRGRALAPGERLRVEYGAGAAGARADRHADGESCFRFAVDGDGDGVRALVAEAPCVVVRPGPPAALLAQLDSSARPSGTARLVLAVVDSGANAHPEFSGEIALDWDAGLSGPARVTLGPADGACAEVAAQVREPGLWRVRASAPGLAPATSNPLQASAAGRRVLWADLHGHSSLSDGTGSPEAWWSYARRVAGLDVAALTDHDHWGQPFLDATPALWERLKASARAAHEEGRFVALLGYEWTSWTHGHRHVLSFEDDLPLLSSLDPAHGTPRQLWDALAGRDVLTFAHHSAGGPVATNWSYAPDPRLEPVTEVASVHGSSEAQDAPSRIYSFQPGNAVRDALGAGYRLGFVGSGDGHDGHPGLAHLGAPSGGLAAILAEEATRAAVLEALRARRCYATSGPRILLRAALGGLPMGSEVPPGDGLLLVHVAGTAPLERLDLVRGAQVADATALAGEDEASVAFGLTALEPGEFVYVRVLQQDGHAGWSSPFFVGPARP